MQVIHKRQNPTLTISFNEEELIAFASVFGMVGGPPTGPRKHIDHFLALISEHEIVDRFPLNSKYNGIYFAE